MATAQFSRRVLARTIAQKLVAEPARTRHWIEVLATYLVEHNRTHEAELIMHDVQHELYEQAGELLVEVTSARPLTEEIRTQLKEALTEQTRAQRITLQETVDPSLIGGLVARTPDAELDASVRASLQRLATIS